MDYQVNIKEKSLKIFHPNEVFKVIGIAASPDRLDSLKHFLDQMIPTSGLAFVIVPLGTSKNKTFPLDQLSAHTTMNICHALDDVEIVPNRIYLVPPQKNIAIRSDTL